MATDVGALDIDPADEGALTAKAAFEDAQTSWFVDNEPGGPGNGEPDPNLPGDPDGPDGPPASSTPAPPGLSSLPGAPVTVYLDFNGHIHDGAWGDHEDTGTPDFDADGIGGSFSAEERGMIEHIWSIVAEDFAPFNVNVTTVFPEGGIQDGESIRVVIGGDGDWYSDEASGVARIDAFTNPNEPNTAFVFAEDFLELESRYAGVVSIGNTVSHEAGHVFGLIHQSDIAGGEEYHRGDGTTNYIM